MIIKKNKDLNDDFWSDKNVFVTGASGFVGSAILKTLVESGANTVALLRDLVPKSNLFLSGIYKEVTLVHGSLEDYDLIKRALNEYDIQVIFHLGAQTQVLTALSDPPGTFSANIKGSWNVLEAARQTKGVESVVVSSSDKAYGIADRLPYTEGMPLIGAFPYEVSKSCMDLIAQSYFHTYNLPVSIARCGNTYGGGDLNFRRLIPKVIKYVKFGIPLVMRSDGKPKRDFVYIDDIVAAYLALGKQTPRAGIRGEAFNFSSGTALSVREVVELMLKLMRTGVKPQWTKPPENEIPEQYLSIEKAKRVLDWSPRVKLEDGLRRTIDWYLRFFENQKNHSYRKKSFV